MQKIRKFPAPRAFSPIPRLVQRPEVPRFRRLGLDAEYRFPRRTSGRMTDQVVPEEQDSSSGFCYRMRLFLGCLISA